MRTNMIVLALACISACATSSIPVAPTPGRSTPAARAAAAFEYFAEDGSFKIDFPAGVHDANTKAAGDHRILAAGFEHGIVTVISSRRVDDPDATPESIEAFARGVVDPAGFASSPTEAGPVPGARLSTRYDLTLGTSRGALVVAVHEPLWFTVLIVAQANSPLFSKVDAMASSFAILLR